MVLCPLQVESSSAPHVTPVADLSFRNFLGLNQQTYERLKTSLSLGLRRQIFIGVCDDLPLRDRLALQLQTELAYFSEPANPFITHSHLAEPRAIPKLVTLELNLYDPNPIVQVMEWLQDLPTRRLRRQTFTPAFQILGIEQLTRQSATIQNLFLTYLQTIDQQLPLFESSIVLWMTQPWFRMLPEAVPEFWACRTGVFEFIGDPMPLPVAQPERIRRDVAPAREVFTEAPPNLPSSAQAESATERPNNPWLPLAEDLNTWYEDPDTGSGQSSSVNSQIDKAVPLELDPWQKAFEQTIGQETQAFVQEFVQEFVQDNGQSAIGLSPITASTSVSISEESVLAIADQLLAVLQQLPETAPDAEAEMQMATANPIADPIVDQAAADLYSTSEALPLLEQIGLLQQQIESLQQDQASPLMLANAYRTLGNFYRTCVEQGEPSAEHITIAIQTYEQALQWLPEGSLERAETLNDLGSLYWIVAHLQTGPETAVCLQQTLHLYQLAHQSLDPQQHAALYASIQNNLGATYADLAQYQETSLNLQRSIEAYQQVLQYRTATTDPLRYAATQNNLGTTFWNLAQQQQPEHNLRQAIYAYSEALRYHVPAEEPLNYAMIQSNLGTAYWNLAQYEQPRQNLQLALAAYQTALQYRPLEVAPGGFAATQNNLGTAYWHLANHAEDRRERIGYLQRAIAAYDTTLKAVEVIELNNIELALNFDLASTHNNLGFAYAQLAIEASEQIESASKTDYLDAALHHHIQAFQSWATNAELQQVAFNGILQTVRAFYTHFHLSGQNRALSQLPSDLLAEVLAKL